MTSTKFPEASGRDLTQYKAQLQTDGYCIIPSVLSPSQSQQTLSRLWAAAEESRNRGSDTYIPRLDPNESNVRVFYLLELDQAFRDLIAHPTAVDMVQSLLGEEFLVSNFTANIARPGSGSMGLHSDLSLQCPDPWVGAWAVNVIWCLTDTTFSNGSTLFIPGSHKWTTRTDVPSDADAESMLQPLEAKAGSIICIEGRIWHTSGKNVTRDQDRALLFGAYNAPFLRGQVNWAAGLSEETKGTLNPNMRDWLGVDARGNTERVKGVNRVY
ncbi:phytanoyl-CoA dioxygenase family protein [Pleomassaria siparia CBS 279.74]|uniref:Phytanoyl-CoA dioxygenase family protein n=1 Tax=Pleomassaria siparia CBS 279.74 TaxID=1314801 RepID=A0A6G1K701_9PLEO|nr:phytanoyl-CoA dioxygenase family protein [Pleomassaria siparia CBS 279.74]